MAWMTMDPTKKKLPINTEPLKGWKGVDPNKSYYVIPAEEVFRLHATHGITIDIVRDMAFAKGMLIDEAGFRRLMDDHRKISRPPGKHLGLRGHG